MICAPKFRAKAALIAACSLPLGIAQALAPVADEQSRMLDAEIQLLKSDMLSMASEIASLDKQIRCPEESCVSVYATVRLSGFLLDEMEVTVDDGTPVRYAYNGSESRAMLNGGAHRLLSTNLEPGPHRLRVTMRGRYGDAKVDDPPEQATTEVAFVKSLKELHLLVPVKRERRRPGLPEVTNLEVGAVASRGPLDGNRDSRLPLNFEAGTDDDPRLRMARYLFEDDRYFSALVELNKIRASSDVREFPEDFYWLQADAQLSFGLYRDASQTLARLADSTDQKRLARQELRLARFAYQRSDLPEAEHVLARLRPRLPDDLLDDWREQQSLTLLAQSRYSEALGVLEAINDSEARNPYSRFNEGMTLIKDGRPDEGRVMLDGVGTMRVTDLNELALRDKANLTLGYYFLKEKQGGTAKPLFGRVRVEGPHSNRSLLGLGWAELAPRGERQQRFALGDEPSDLVPYSSFATLGVLIRPGYFDANLFARLGLGSFKLGDVSEESSSALLKALVPWVQLIKRDQMDPAVQEGMLAIPFALDRLGAHQQSLQYYLQAIKVLEEARKRIDESLASAQAGVMIETMVREDLDAETGWNWKLLSLPDVPETYWVSDLLAQHRFQESIKNYRDTRLMSRLLNKWRDQIAAIPQELKHRSLSRLPLEQLVRRARSNYQAPENPPLELRMDQQLGGGWFNSQRIQLRGPAPRRLQLAQAPRRFAGPLEELETLQPKLLQMRPKIRDAGQRQDALLKQMLANELNLQKKEIERYLLEARFSVARIYDRQLRGETR